MMELLLGGALAALALEAGARAVYRRRYSLSYRPRIYGDYRYGEFIERVAPPLSNRMRAGYRSRCVNVNRFSLRGPEPDDDGRRKRLVVIGESDIFGVKLDREASLWSVLLQQRLEETHGGRWEVLNGGHPGYNSLQHRLLWEELWETVRPDALLLRFGGNDISQAYAMGSRWRPGAPWPAKFLWAMNSVQTPLQRLLLQSCLYYMGPGKALFRRTFGDVVKTFREENWEGVRDEVVENHRALIDRAKGCGVPVAIVSDGSLEHCVRNDEDRRALDALNENWRAFAEGYGSYYNRFQDILRESATAWDVPYLDLRQAICSRGRPGELFYDGVHWNGAGQEIVARSFYDMIDSLDWWGRDGAPCRGGRDSSP